MSDRHTVAPMDEQRVEWALDAVIDALRLLTYVETRHVLLRVMRHFLNGAETEDL